MKQSILKDKSKLFALRVIRLYKYLCEEKKEYVLSKQLLRSGTSIGANIAEAFTDKAKQILLRNCLSRRKKRVKPFIG